jgi:beta-glucanase (GH16 family)
MKMSIKKYSSYLYMVVLLVSSTTLTFCSEKKNNPVDSTENDDTLSIAGYELLWNDEFNDTSIDGAKWIHEVNGNGGGNNELQYYTDRIVNSYVKDGNLFIVAEQEEFTGSDGTRYYTSARMTTQETKSFMYGKITARIKLPYGQGMWPAFWMLGLNIDQVGWPKCGEIDIMEMIGGGDGRDNVTHGTLHWDNDGHQSQGNSKQLESGIFADDFHEFTIDWNSERIDWYLDNIRFYSLDITNESLSEFHQHYFIILNLAVGGNWPGDPIPETQFPQIMEIDYVRVYQKE